MSHDGHQVLIDGFMTDYDPPIVVRVANTADVAGFPRFSMPVIRPEYCYDNAFEFAHVNSIQTWVVVHGVLTPTDGPNKGKQIGHGWVERDHGGIRWAFDPTARLLMPADAYYRDSFVGYTAIYSISEARFLVGRSGHTGAWDGRVRAAAHNP